MAVPSYQSMPSVSASRLSLSKQCRKSPRRIGAAQFWNCSGKLASGCMISRKLGIVQLLWKAALPSCRGESPKTPRADVKALFAQIILAQFAPQIIPLSSSHKQKTDKKSCANCSCEFKLFFVRSRPGRPNQRKGQNEKFRNFAHACEFWCFSSFGKKVRFTSNFCSRLPPGKVHELAFLWFGNLCKLFLFEGEVFWVGGFLVGLSSLHPILPQGLGTSIHDRADLHPEILIEGASKGGRHARASGISELSAWLLSIHPRNNQHGCPQIISVLRLPWPTSKSGWHFSDRSPQEMLVMSWLSEIPRLGTRSRKICCHFRSVGFGDQSKCSGHRDLQGAPPRGRQLYFTFPSAPDPHFLP